MEQGASDDFSPFHPPFFEGSNRLHQFERIGRSVPSSGRFSNYTQ